MGRARVGGAEPGRERAEPAHARLLDPADAGTRCITRTPSRVQSFTPSVITRRREAFCTHANEHAHDWHRQAYTDTHAHWLHTSGPVPWCKHFPGTRSGAASPDLAQPATRHLGDMPAHLCACVRRPESGTCASAQRRVAMATRLRLGEATGAVQVAGTTHLHAGNHFRSLDPSLHCYT